MHAEHSAEKIRLLPASVAERIAAGEVIERPASVVKELVENALDAQATEVAVILGEGGKELIEVLDNGHGMPPKDLELCLKRHATSKLSSLDDLEKISTLGFRGEALPSVAAVSELSLISRSRQSAETYEIRAGDLFDHPQRRAEKITFGHFINSPHGTQVRACGLFSQIPARLKFLKSQSAEVSQVREWMERLALAHPATGFRLVSEDRLILDFRPESQEERVRRLLSDGDADYPLLIASSDQDGFRDRGLKVRVFWLQGMSCPNSRKLIQVVNQRAVRDRMLQQALLAPFRQALLPGQFPAVALFVEANPAALDVNVHPTKMEIRFLDQGKIFRTVESTLKGMIQKNGAPAIVPLPKSEVWKASESSFPEQASSFSRPAFSRPLFSKEPLSETPSLFEPQASLDRVEGDGLQTRSVFQETLGPARYLGILFQTYLLYEGHEESILIDQHAAHERVRYERLKKRVIPSSDPAGPPSDRILASQALLLPEAVKFSSEDRPKLEERLSWILPLGFEAEIFGEDTVLFRSVPPEWGKSSLKIRLKGLLDRLMQIERDPKALPSVLVDETLFEALASEACHSAIRAGDSLEKAEAESLVEQLFQCEHPWNCPHGRPTVVKIPAGKFEEWFQRKPAF